MSKYIAVPTNRVSLLHHIPVIMMIFMFLLPAPPARSKSRRHHIAQLGMRLNKRLLLVADLRALLISIGVRDQVILGPLGTQEAETEWQVRRVSNEITKFVRSLGSTLRVKTLGYS